MSISGVTNLKRSMQVTLILLIVKNKKENYAHLMEHGSSFLGLTSVVDGTHS